MVPSFERIREVFKQVLEAQDEGATVQITPSAESEVIRHGEKDDNSNSRN